MVWFGSSYTSWLFMIIIIFVLLWLFLGGGNYEFIGIPIFPSDGRNNKEEINTTPILPLFISSEVNNPLKQSEGERICREVISRIYNKNFPRCRPKWLINPETGRRLELDCYNEELGIAIQYNDISHYKYPNHTNQSYRGFVNQVKKDNLKVELCDRNGVYLITVPYNVSKNKIEEYIKYYLPENIGI